MVLDRLAEKQDLTFSISTDLKRYAWCAMSAAGPVLAKPRTYMNRSGRAAAALCRFHGARPEELLVVYDDADLPLGRIRIRRTGGAGGHNGIRSLIEVLGTPDFPRVRLGVKGEGRDDGDLADYVLDSFELDELQHVGPLIDLGVEGVEEILERGIEAAMNRFNTQKA
jgi:PTH1 family peptidyl-tRNA hydrolase